VLVYWFLLQTKKFCLTYLAFKFKILAAFLLLYCFGGYGLVEVFGWWFSFGREMQLQAAKYYGTG